MVFGKLKDRRQDSGFTLVELLIVIVVIAILAAITIVAYGNISARAKTTQGATATANTVKVAEAINADNSKYPDLYSDLTTGSTSTKLPSGLTVVQLNNYATVIPATATALSTLFANSTTVFGSTAPSSGNTVVVVPICSAAGAVQGGAVYGYDFTSPSTKVSVSYYGSVNGSTTVSTGSYPKTVDATASTHC